jgi:lipid-binding SYLF domain-containing protein
MNRIFAHAGALVLIVGLGLPTTSAADEYQTTIERFKASETVKPYFANAYGFAVFPVVGKGGLIIGAAHGDGKVYRGGKVTGTASLTHISIGFQLGGQAFSEMVFFKDKRAYEDFTSGSFEFDAKASAVAITAGAQAQASTAGSSAGASVSPSTGKQLGASYNNGMAVFVHIKGGLMYEAAVGGQKFSFKPTGG